MLAPALLMALAATLQASPAPQPVRARAQTQLFVRIVLAAEVRGGQSSTPHQRTVRLSASGQRQILLQFE